jgi:hypothetical protein
VGDLILVEGVPGTGKSTTAQFLARQLRHHGRAARWIYEEEAPNPFVPPGDDFPTWDAFAEAHLERWQTFAREAASAPDAIIAESYLLQRPVFTMFRRDVDAAGVEALVRRFAEAVAPLRPRLIQLAHPDPAASWRAIAAKRGPTFTTAAIARAADWPFLQARGLSGLDGVLAYWRAHGALCDAIAARMPMEMLAVDVSTGEWSARRAQLCAFVGVPLSEPPRPGVADLARFTGRYTDGQREIVVGLDDGQLSLSGVLWATNPLLPVANGLFDVEAWPFQVSFDGDGLTWQGPRLWWGGPAGRFQRIAT